MNNKFTLILIFLFFHPLAKASLDLPPEVKEAFSRASVGEDGYLYPSGSGRDLIIEYVKNNWKDLLDQLADVPSEAGSIRSAARVVGNAAEELPPLDYLDFLDHYLTAYSRGHIEDELLRWQLAGVDRKNYFITVNAAHPRVRNLLLRAKELVPKENVAFQEYLDEEFAGKRTDMYFANKSDDARPPETLPGIKLRKPFESLIAKMNRNRKDSEEATKRDLPARDAASETGTNVAAESDEGISGRRIWILGAALMVLLFAVWKGVFKKFASKRETA